MFQLRRFIIMRPQNLRLPGTLEHSQPTVFPSVSSHTNLVGKNLGSRQYLVFYQEDRGDEAFDLIYHRASH